MSLNSNNNSIQSHLKLGYKIILFDDDCLLCNRIVQYIIRHDHRKVFLFASINNTIVQDYIKEQHPSLLGKDSIILAVANELPKIEFKAIYTITKDLQTAWYPFLKILSIFPSSLLNQAYRIVARYRKLINTTSYCKLEDVQYNNRILYV